MNFYSSLIYIAFFKGRFYDHPGDEVMRRSDFYRLKGDICDPAGCLSELCIQLAIIMVGKQVWNNFMEYLFPYVILHIHILIRISYTNQIIISRRRSIRFD